MLPHLCTLCCLLCTLNPPPLCSSSAVWLWLTTTCLFSSSPSPHHTPTCPTTPCTTSMVFAANDSPFAGRSGKAVTGRVIGQRLQQEAETSVSLRVTPLSGSTERYEVQARGEMQLGVLIETLRREGLELAVSPPQVLYK